MEQLHRIVASAIATTQDSLAGALPTRFQRAITVLISLGPYPADWGKAMSMEIAVLSNKRLDSIDAWQRAIDTDRPTLILDRTRPIEDLEGYLPVKCGNDDTGFECDHGEASDILDQHESSRWTYALSFRWGGDLAECFAAYVAATAYARAVGGVVFDADGGVFLTPQEANVAIREIEDALER